MKNSPADRLSWKGIASHSLTICFFCLFFLSDRDRDAAELPSDGSKMDGDAASSKRRHSRPLELDSEGEENDTSGKEEELVSDREEEPEEAEAPDRLLSAKVGFIIFTV